MRVEASLLEELVQIKIADTCELRGKDAPQGGRWGNSILTIYGLLYQKPIMPQKVKKATSTNMNQVLFNNPMLNLLSFMMVA